MVQTTGTEITYELRNLLPRQRCFAGGGQDLWKVLGRSDDVYHSLLKGTQLRGLGEGKRDGHLEPVII